VAPSYLRRLACSVTGSAAEAVGWEKPAVGIESATAAAAAWEARRKHGSSMEIRMWGSSIEAAGMRVRERSLEHGRVDRTEKESTGEVGKGGLVLVPVCDRVAVGPGNCPRRELGEADAADSVEAVGGKRKEVG
jgi:hypothetical protein